MSKGGAASRLQEQAAVRRALARNIETKRGMQMSNDGIEIVKIAHNNFIT